MGQALKGKTAAVTGASSGIGQVIAEALGKEGAHVFMCGRNMEPMEASKALIEEAGGGATLSTFDMRDEEAIRGFIDAATAHAGRLDVMVNNAGFGNGQSIMDGDPEDWRGMFDVNVIGLLIGCQQAIRKMRETKSTGHIINISSTATLRRDSGVYGATKYAVNCINSTLRQELEDDTIRVTAIKPGVFASNFIRNMDPEMINGMAASIGLGDLNFKKGDTLDRDMIAAFQKAMGPTVGDTQEIAKAVLYVVQQPIELNIEELVIRPQKSMTI